MILLFGLQPVIRTLTSRAGTCRYCQQYVQQRLQERASKFTLFFIPVLTVRKRYQITCSNCGGTTEISRQQKDAYIDERA